MKLGLEGMTAEDIAQMSKDLAEEDAYYHDALTRWRDRLLPKQKQTVYEIMGRTFGCGFEEPFSHGHFTGISEGRRQMARDLKRMTREELLAFFGHKVEP